MTTLNLFCIVSLSTDTVKFLTNKSMSTSYIYQLEDSLNTGGIWVLYDTKDGVRTTSHRMSKLTVNVLPFEQIND